MSILDDLEQLGRELAHRIENSVKKPGPHRPAPPADNPPAPLLFPLADQAQTLAQKVHIRPPLEHFAFGPKRPSALPPGGEVIVAAYNLERGMCFDEQVTLFKTHPMLKRAHVLLLNELDRGCSRSGCRHVARGFAQALGMNGVFAVEYVELPRQAKLPVNQVDAACEHGNAILSPWPLSGFTQLRHSQSENHFHHPEQPRLGGVVSLGADVALGGFTLRTWCVHFSANPVNERLRTAQALELAGEIGQHPGPVVVGGDMNTSLFHTLDLHLGTQFDGTVKALKNAGFEDAHQQLPARHRGTTDKTYGLSVAIDLLFHRGLKTADAGIVSPLEAGHLSDHLPVWARLIPA